MCWQIYLAADHGLPVIPWNVKAPDFHVTSTSGKQLGGQMSKRLIYRVGSHEGCACGFGVLDPAEPSDMDRAGMRQLGLLADYLQTATRRGPVELLVCWIGEEARPPDERMTVSPAFFREGYDDVFLSLSHRRLYTVE